MKILISENCKNLKTMLKEALKCEVVIEPLLPDGDWYLCKDEMFEIKDRPLLNRKDKRGLRYGHK